MTSHLDRHLVGEAEGQDPDAAVDIQEALVCDLFLRGGGGKEKERKKRWRLAVEVENGEKETSRTRRVLPPKNKYFQISPSSLAFSADFLLRRVDRVADAFPLSRVKIGSIELRRSESTRAQSFQWPHRMPAVKKTHAPSWHQKLIRALSLSSSSKRQSFSSSKHSRWGPGACC